MEFEDIPREFIDTTLTDFQKKTIEIKWTIVERIKNRGEETIINTMYDLTEDLNIVYDSVRYIYYTYKNKLKEKEKQNNT